MREIVHLQAGQCGNQIGAKVRGQVSAGRTHWDSQQGKMAEAAGSVALHCVLGTGVLWAET